MLPLWSASLSPRCCSGPPWLSPPHDVVLWTDDSVPFPFGKEGSGMLANCFLCGTEATLSFSAGPVCSSFSAKACAILHTPCWSRQHQQVCRFSSLLLSDSRFVLATLSSSPSFLLPQSLWQELSPLLLNYQTTMGLWTLVSPSERPGWWAGQTGSVICALCNLL